MDLIKIPLPGMVHEKVSTPYTEIPDDHEVPPRPKKDTPPDLPPRINVENGSNVNQFFQPKQLPKQQQSISLIKFAKDFYDQFPIHVKVSQGYYGSSNFETISGQQELVVFCEKKREVLCVRSNSGKTYSLPYGSSVPISILYDPDNNVEKAKTGMTFKSLANLPHDHLPKVLACSTSDGKLPISNNEILVIKMLDVQNQKLHIHSIQSKDEGATASEKELDLTCKTKSTFSTRPDSVALYLSDIIRYVRSPCENNCKALLDLSELSSVDHSNVMHADLKLSEPVVLLERKNEASLVVVQADSDGSFENSEFFEIPLDEKFGIEFTVLDTQNAMYSSLQPPSYPSVFSLKKLKLWVTDTFEPSQAIQQIFNSSLRSGHEMEGIDIPQQRYEKIKDTSSSHSATKMPVSVPVSSSDEAPPLLPPKPKPTTEALPPIKINVSPQQSNGSSLSTPPNTAGLVESPAQDFTKTQEFKELLDKAVRERLSGPLERLLSISSSESDSPQETTMPKFGSHTEKRQSNKLTPDELCEIVSELADCEGQWFYLAIYLGVPKSRIDQITATHSSDPRFCRRGLIEAVSYWLDNSPNASWSAIVKALFVLEKKNKARELAEKYDADIPSVGTSEDPTSLQLHGDLSLEEKEEVKKLRKQMEQKSEELQDVQRNITKYKQRLEGLENELAEVKRKLEFNEEYTLVLTYGSQISALKMNSEREGTTVRDKVAYERRIQNVQAETTKLQQQLIWIERECRAVNGSLQSSQKQKTGISQGLMKLEERLHEMVMSGDCAQDTMETQLESPEYYNIIYRNGMMEQKIHQKEIAQLQEELEHKEDQLMRLKEKLKKTQESLAKVEHRLSSQYSYVAQGDTFVQDENLKTSLQADKVNYHLKIANIHFSKTEMQLKLDARESKMQKTKQRNLQIQDKMQQAKASKGATKSSRSSTSSEYDDVHVPKKSIKAKSKIQGESRTTTQQKQRAHWQSAHSPSKANYMEKSEQRRRATDAADSRKTSSHRPRTGATASRALKKN